MEVFIITTIIFVSFYLWTRFEYLKLKIKYTELEIKLKIYETIKYYIEPFEKVIK